MSLCVEFPHRTGSSEEDTGSRGSRVQFGMCNYSANGSAAAAETPKLAYTVL